MMIFFKRRITQLLLLFYFPLHFLIYVLSFIIVRNKNVFLYGSFYGESFSDNSKYLFLIANRNYPSKKHIWISSNKSDIAHIRFIGFKAFHKFSIKGIYYSFTAAKHYYTQSTWDTCFFITHNSVRVNLWHGIPLKKIGADYQGIKKKSILKEAINYEPYIFNTKEIILAPSEFIAPFFTSAFRDRSNQTIIATYPRLAVFLMSKLELLSWIQEYETDYLKNVLKRTQNYRSVWTYMPTWRDTNPSFINDAVQNWEELDSIAKHNDAILIVKVHFMTEKPSNLELFKNIFFFDSKTDFYPILALSDLLITDYSSVFFDYLLMKKPIVFYAFDLEIYKQKSREIYFNYEEIVYGNIIYSYRELIDYLSNFQINEMTSDEIVKCNKLAVKMWGSQLINLSEEFFYSQLEDILSIQTKILN